jgi:vibriolysin
LEVSDKAGAKDSTFKDVTVTGGGGGSTLSGSAVNNGKNWTATVTDSSGGTLGGAWSYSGGSAGCSGSSCSLSGIPKKEGSVTFIASGGEQITVLKP